MEYLKSQRLTPKLVYFVLNSIAMCDMNTGCLEGLKATHMFLQSLGVYGALPSLYPLYGSGELPQAYCR